MALNLTAVCDALSADRMAPYRAGGGSDGDALQLYQRNLVLTEAISPSLHILEVTFRNRFEIFLLRTYGPDWYTDTNFLGIIAGKNEELMLNKAINDLNRRGKTPTSGRVVAEVTFGFWTGLLGNHYNGRFWGPAWRTLFPHQTSVTQRNIGTQLSQLERQVNRMLRDLRFLRNRVFHHEPIWNDQRLWDKHRDLRTLLQWMDPAVADWTQHTQLDRFPNVYQILKELRP